MQYLTNENYHQINDTINTYNKASKQLKSLVNSKIIEKRTEIFNQYQLLCQNNQDWLNAYDFTTDYEEVTSFNMNSNFEVTVGDSTQRQKVYSETLYQDYLDAYKHRHAYIKIIGNKLAQLDHERFSIGKKSRKKYLTNRLNAIQTEADLFAGWKEKEQQKNEYLSTKTELYQSEKNKREQLEKQFAIKVVCENLQTCGILACAKENQTLTTTFQVNGNTYQIDSSTIDTLCSQIRNKALNINTQNKSDNEPTRI